jgi:putative transposase
VPGAGRRAGDDLPASPAARAAADEAAACAEQGAVGVRERRDQLTHPAYAKPELLAERPNQLWSWDISKLKGPATWTWFYLYVILDVFSRYVVGWTVQYRETGPIAEALIAQSCEQQQITREQLTVHADRGGPMRSKPVAFLLSDLGVGSQCTSWVSR